MADSKMKGLAKDTAIYGLSSIVGRFLNYLLVPIYTRVFLEGEYGIVTNIYAYVALVFVILTYGMETTFFRYVNKEDNPTKVYSTTLISIGTTALLFVVTCFLFLNPISAQMGYADHPEYIGMFAIIVALDAFTSIPFAYLRYQKRPIRFASIKMSMILLNILLNIFFIVACPRIYESNSELISWFYNPDYGIGYIFFANLLTSGIALLLLLPFVTGFRYIFDKDLLKRMLRYTMPLLVLGIAGVLNQAVDKIIYPFLFDDAQVGNAQLGIYGACAKIAVIMTMFTQAFRYAYEPFIFAQNKEDKSEDKKKSYAAAMKYFIIFGVFAFLIVMFYLDFFQYIIDVRYRAGLAVVPILMLSEIFFGIYFNLSLWYKLTDKTHYGAIFSLIGTVIIISINVIFVPKYGYIASAWASFAGNLLMMLISYIFGQKYFPINYSLRTIGFYFLLATGLYLLAISINIDNEYLRILYRTVLLSVFVAIMVKRDLPLSQIPIINKWVKK